MELEKLDAVATPRIIEAAVVVLSEKLGIDDPLTGVERLLELSGSAIDRSELDMLVREAAERGTDDVVDLLRLLLSANGAAAVADEAEVERALELAGRKQLVITPDMLYMAALLAVCGIAMLRNPKLSEHHRVTIEEAPDGKKKTQIETKAVYFNPFSPLVKLIERVIGIGSGS